MKRQEKNNIVDNLSEEIKKYSHFYIADISDLDAVDTGNLRRKCFEKEIKLIVVKNTLLKRALEKDGNKYEEIHGSLKGPTSIMLSNTGNIPAKLIKEFRKEKEKPILKAAFVEESMYFGDEQLETLASLKSKEEIIGDIILMLQSPVKNIISGLNSAGGKLAGILKTLSEKE